MPATEKTTTVDASPSCLPLKDVRILRPALPSTPEQQDVIRVQGRVASSDVRGGVLHYFAAAPFDRRNSFSGSGLPFANAEQAFSSSPNVGSVKLQTGGAFQIDVVAPNAYYVGLGSVYTPPAVHLWCESAADGSRRDASVKVGNGVPFRMLTYPTLPTRPREGPLFYKPAPTLARSQEQILRDSAYPSYREIAAGYAMPDNFWGLRPPF